MPFTPFPLSQTVTPSRTPLERDVIYGRPHASDADFLTLHTFDA